jgi:hypothetical protein
MMAKTKLKLNEKNVSTEILKSAAMQQECVKVANQIRSRAGSEYLVTSGRHRFRAYANVGDPTDGSMFREAQTGELARALASMGVKPRYGKKPRTNPKK